MLIEFAAGTDYDSRLEIRYRNSMTNCDLYLGIRVFLQQVNPAPVRTMAPSPHPHSEDRYPDADQQRLRIQRWRGVEWSAWTQRYAQEVQEYWSGKFWIMTPVSYFDLDCPDSHPTHRPNVYCRLRIELVRSAENAHKMIRCVRLQNDEIGFRSHAGLYDSRDLDPVDMVAGSPHLTHYHEVGHLLGLGHSAQQTPECVATGDSNSAVCYGVTADQSRDVMGRGSELNLWHATPWQRAMARLTQTQSRDWRATMSRAAPEPLGDTSRGRATMAGSGAVFGAHRWR